MGRVTFINAEISGKVAGQVYARNKGGAYVRQWAKPTNPRTNVQTTVRGNFSDNSKIWSSLTDGQKASWNAYASTYFKPKKIKPGVTYSGLNALMSLRNSAVQANVNQRVAELVVSATPIVLTQTTLLPSAEFSSSVFGGTPTTQGHSPVPVTVKDASVDVNGVVGVTFNQLASNEGHPLLFEDAGSGTALGFVVFGSLPNSSNSKEIMCLGSTGLMTVTSGWEEDTTEFTLAFNENDIDLTGRKIWYQAGQKVVLTVYAISAYGEQVLIGTKNTFVGS